MKQTASPLFETNENLLQKREMINIVIPTQQQLLASIPDRDKLMLYKHFEGAAHPDELIYLAWLWANSWIHDPEVSFEKIIDPVTNECAILEILNLDSPKASVSILYHFWKMEEVSSILKDLVCRI